jgi:glycosyltransferase involved in cell wall biosynthesis
MIVYADLMNADAAPAVVASATASLPSPAPAARPLVRVLYVITRLNVGGPAWQLLELGQGLEPHGFAPTLVYGTEEPDEDTLEDLVEAGRIHGIKIPALARPVRPWHDLRAFWRLTQLMFAERPAIVHTHTAKAGALGRLAAWIYNATRARGERCLVVHTFHGHVFAGYFGRAGSGVVRVIERGLALGTDRIVTISPQQRREICERFHIAPTDKTAVIELGADLEPLLQLEPDPAVRGALGFAPHHVVFGYAGRFVPIKDLETLVRAFAATAAHCAEARLLLMGDGPLRNGIERLVDDLGLRERVRFTGWLRGIQSVYSALDVAVLASLNEGTPRVLLEAMAAGRPVVATAVGGVGDLVSPDRTGLLVPPRDVPALAAAMTRLATCPELRDRLGAAGRHAMAIRFSRNGVVEGVAGLYDELLSDRRDAVRKSASPDNVA